MPQTEGDQATPNPTSTESITGRSVFLVETTAAGIAVQTALLTADSQLLRAAAVFPDVEYAFAQIDELKRLVARHFSEAARIGAQVVAAQQNKQLPPSDTGSQDMFATETASAEASPPARSAKAKKSQSR